MKKIDEKTQNYLFTLVLVLFMIGGLFIAKNTAARSAYAEPTVVMDTIEIVGHRDSLPTLTEENLMRELLKEEIKFPEIVMAQAKLETGNFSSNLCVNHGNLFGLRKGNSYRRYKHWTESVKAYRDLVQYKYKGEDYYVFLDKIGYAESGSYVQTLKRLVNN